VRVYFWLVFLFPNIGNATVIGSGIVGLSVSAEKNQENFGVSGSYDLNTAGPRLETKFYSQFQLGTNLGRTKEAVAEHDYLYEQSFIETRGGFVYFFPVSSIKWKSGYNSKTEFIQDEEFDSSLKSNFDETQNSWSFTTGPSLILNKNNGFVFEVGTNWSYMASLDETITEKQYNIDLQRKITPITQLGINASKVCSEFGVATENNMCRVQHNLVFSSKKKTIDLRLEAGISSDGNTSTDIYSGSVNYLLNRNSEINLATAKSISAILSNEESIFEVNDTILSTLIATNSLEYSHGAGPRNFSIEIIEQNLIIGSNNTTTLVGSVELSHPLYSKLCLYCVLSLNYDYANYNNEKLKKIHSITLTKRHSRKLSSSINFSRTWIESELDVWSIGLSLTYNGQKTKQGDG